ncbi:MAG: Glycosyl transferase family 2, partial [candidate division WS6 bacterium GW2011_GWC1_33_20]
TPYAELIHYESVTRFNTKERLERDESNALKLRKKWNKYMNNDPFYNVNLSIDHEDFRITI